MREAVSVGAAVEGVREAVSVGAAVEAREARPVSVGAASGAQHEVIDVV